VIIGDNGSGKSSVLRAAALALVGPAQAWGLRQDWDTWLRREAARGEVKVTLRAIRSFPNLARHMTVFGEAYALTEALQWLRELNYRKLEKARMATCSTRSPSSSTRRGSCPTATGCSPSRRRACGSATRRAPSFRSSSSATATAPSSA